MSSGESDIRDLDDRLPLRLTQQCVNKIQLHRIISESLFATTRYFLCHKCFDKPYWLRSCIGKIRKGALDFTMGGCKHYLSHLNDFFHPFWSYFPLASPLEYKKSRRENAKSFDLTTSLHRLVATSNVNLLHKQKRKGSFGDSKKHRQILSAFQQPRIKTATSTFNHVTKSR